MHYRVRDNTNKDDDSKSEKSTGELGAGTKVDGSEKTTAKLGVGAEVDTNVHVSDDATQVPSKMLDKLRQLGIVF